MFLGIDIGSSSSKAVIMTPEGMRLAEEVVNLGTGTKGARLVLETAFKASGITKDDILFTVVTGYGRTNYPDADKKITEISCHGKAVQFLYPNARTIIDIGGQDSKIISLDPSGAIQNFTMNDKCAAGTGRFLEVMARVTDCSLLGLSDLAAQGENPVSISSMCTVFAESEVISHLSSGISVSDVAAGAILSIAKRISGMAKRIGVVPGCRHYRRRRTERSLSLRPFS